MKASFHITFESDWRRAPMAFWVHGPVPGQPGQFDPPAPELVLHRGYPFLRVQVGVHELQFSSPAQLDHLIDILSRKLLPTSRQLSRRRGPNVGPNGHWLSRLPGALKSPRQRFQLVRQLQVIRALVMTNAADRSFTLPDR